MDIHPQILLFAGSLIAILALAGLARLLQLGGTPVLATEEDAREAASEVWDGYQPHRIALDRDGAAALLDDANGRIMLIKRHGNQFTGRILLPTASASVAGDTLEVDSGEARFGRVSLTIDDAAAWEAAINALDTHHHA
ncbi:hypothetical protein [Erythrobacter sp. JK5]|uniref:hypothetical protein n=1 Tax=Erythrobacter sp. JK5 TaxID=2829500 RepID=UPI001BA7F712|nr:hypothetical protein [Erythrobacter sp. JK5]QUL37475.1 hypothetical protein KDC96_14150 [Erythrobacter sp. JK5]